jgi:RND superfamily putative drug exporter
MMSVVGCAVIFNLTFLTALLAILGKRVDWLRLPMRRMSEPGAVWSRIAHAVMRRPGLFLVPALAVVTLVALPIFQINLATDHLSALPPTAESRVGAELIATQFFHQQQSSDEVVVDFGSGAADSPQRQAALAVLDQQISALPTVTSVTQQEIRGRVAVMDVETNAADHSAAARELVTKLRQQTVSGASVLVGGSTAGDMDRTAAILARVPIAAMAVGLMTYVLLFLLLGSSVLPLKAVLTNLLSMTASFGAIVWIFQQGHLSQLLGFTPGPVDPTLPVLLFALLFGLSMDYEVFLLTRIQEEYRRTGDNRKSVGYGLQRNGRLVTFAATIMVAVFASFGLSDVVVFKAAGIGAALAVLVDATLVRGVLVPSLMVLLGRANWWAPTALRPLAARFVENPNDPGRLQELAEEAVA